MYNYLPWPFRDHPHGHHLLHGSVQCQLRCLTPQFDASRSSGADQNEIGDSPSRAQRPHRRRGQLCDRPGVTAARDRDRRDGYCVKLAARGCRACSARQVGLVAPTPAGRALPGRLPRRPAFRASGSASRTRMRGGGAPPAGEERAQIGAGESAAPLGEQTERLIPHRRWGRGVKRARGASGRW